MRECDRRREGGLVEGEKGETRAVPHVYILRQCDQAARDGVDVYVIPSRCRIVALIKKKTQMCDLLHSHMNLHDEPDS